MNTEDVLCFDCGHDFMGIFSCQKLMKSYPLQHGCCLSHSIKPKIVFQKKLFFKSHFKGFILGYLVPWGMTKKPAGLGQVLEVAQKHASVT